MHFLEVNPCKLRDYQVTQMFMCFHRCSCFEPSDPTNGTLKYWEMNNVTVSEIYWEALEVKVLSTLHSPLLSCFFSAGITPTDLI